MAHIFHMTEWESNGKWMCGDVSALAANSNLWWYIPNLLQISPVEYVNLLINTFHAIDLHYSVDKNVLFFKFASLTECRKFKNYINKLAKEKNFTIY